MNLQDLAKSVNERDDLVQLIQALAQDRRSQPQSWENDSLDRYLDALANWLADSEGYYRNQGREAPVTPSWKTFAEMLMAARIYE